MVDQVEKPLPPPRDFVVEADYYMKDKAHICFREVDNMERGAALFERKTRMSVTFRVGHVYSIPTEDVDSGTNRRMSLGLAKWVGPYTDDEWVLREQARHKSTQLAIQAKKREKREATDTGAIEKAMEPIARAYSLLPYPQRAAFEIYVLSLLRKG